VNASKYAMMVQSTVALALFGLVVAIDGPGSPCARDRPAAVHKPVKQGEGDVVAEPGQTAGGEQLRWRVRKWGALDQVVDEEDGLPERRSEQEGDEGEAGRSQPLSAARNARMVARDESDHQHCFDGGHKPPNPNGTSGRKPEPNRDVQHEEGKQCDCRRPTRLPDGRYGHGRTGACPKSSGFLRRHAAILP
jgi:hypothetical protein